ncbi:MAG: hypothetical protein KBC06_01790 [Candidatus Pacebacteria bacterium]|nr:hypothetical protein [Candidatus Paceibacterota bacterium]
MNKKIGLCMLGIFTLLGLFAGTNVASADSATPACTSATLYGTVYPNGATTQAWFEWGPTTSMQYQTPKQTFNSTSSFSQVLNPLNENTTYYFRSMVSNVNGTASGNMLSFKTSSCTPPPTPTNPPSVDLQINGSNSPSAINSGGAANVTWTAQPSNSSSLSCTGSGGTGIWSGGKPLTGLATFYLTQSTTFTIRCTDSNTNLSDSDSVYIAVNPATPTTCQDTNATNYGGALPCRYPTPQVCQDTNAINYGGSLPCRYQTTPPPTVTLTADQYSLAYNGSTILRWSSTNATSCSGTGGTNGWSGARNTSGSFTTGQLTNSASFNISCTNTSGTAGDSVAINVGNQPIQTCQDTNATNYGGALPCRYPTPQVCQDTNAINYGGSLPCRYNTPTPTCQDTSATNYGGTLPCRYQNAQVNVTLSADDISIDTDEGTIIRWDANNATYCSATGGTNGWSGSRNTSGTFFTGSLSSTRTFGITCSNSTGGSDSDSVTIYVNDSGSDEQPTVTISADDTNLDFEDSTKIRWESDNADYCTASGGTNGWSGRRSTSGSFNTGSLDGDETYKITCTNEDNGDTDTDSVTVRVDDDNNDNNNDRPSVTISADRTNLSVNQSTTIRWYPNDADTCTASSGSNGWSGRKSTSGGSFNTGSLSRTTTYDIRCTNDEGSENDSVTVYVSGNNDNNNSYSAAPTAVTTSGIPLSSNTAQLNGLIFSGGSNTTTWFEWGRTMSLGNTTNMNSIGSVESTIHNEIISGLSTGVTYYYRAVAENSNSRSYGSILSFNMRNPNGSVAGTTNTIIRPTTIINRGGGEQSLVMLTIDGGSENIAMGERRNYQVTWKNISGQTLDRVVLRVIFPQSMVFESANKGSFSSDDNTLTLEIGTLSPGEDGSMFLLARAKDALKQGELIVTVANLIYTDRSNAQGDALAYATQRADLSGSVLGANAFGAGFLPNSILGWLLLLILILIIVLLVRYIQNQSRGPKTVVVDHH